MTIRIAKAKITKDNTLEVVYKQTTSQGTEHELIMKGSPTVHVDLHNAFSSLIPHFAKLADTKEADRFEDPSNCDPKLLLALEVTGFSTSDGEKEGVTISGNRKIGTGKQVNMNTPHTAYNDDMDQYKYIDDLRAAIDGCCEECILYIQSEKYSEKQLDLGIDGATVTVEAGGELTHS